MWVGVQIGICILLISIAIILPKKLYSCLMGLGVIFTLFAVFVNWLLIIQILNIIISGGIGIMIIEKRDAFFATAFRKVLRSDKEFDRFKVEKGSRSRIVIIVCSIIVILSYFCNFYYIYGQFNTNIISPIEWFNYYNFGDIIRYGEILGCILLLYYSWSYERQRVEVFIIPAAIRVGTRLIFYVYYGITRGDWGYIASNWFIILSFLIIFLAILLLVNDILKSKKLAVIMCILPIVVALVLTIMKKQPFADTDGYIAISYLISFISYCIAYAVLIGSLRKRTY